MASWLRYITQPDYVKARALAESNEKEDIREMAKVHCREEDRYSHVLIPLSVIFSFLVACSLYAPGLWPGRLYGGFCAIASMFIPILVILRAQQVQQRGRVIALAFYIREYMEEHDAKAKNDASA